MGEGPKSQEIGHHKALGSLRRRTLLAELAAHPEGLDAGALSTLVGSPRNSTRFHLNRLVQEGLVRTHKEVRTVRGRPRTLYRRTATADDVDALSDETSYRDLALLLAGEIAAQGDVEQVARHAGAKWAAALAGGGTSPSPRSLEDARAAVASILGRLGFEPDISPESPQDIALRRCPFETVAREHQAVICGLHLGTLRELAEDMGVPREDVALFPFVSEMPLTCVVRLSEPGPPVEASAVATPRRRIAPDAPGSGAPRRGAE